ncbi:ABC transporter permease [Cysteiniphilum sp. JM-1]|uniref:ABC transporter permease n=1 Tax=Cysteiniphilum sp. JM-1 TaxID=2610891 RepID=UPI001245530E|nr:ABC transporter permease [Cysteiniphilum sp. JM-1]
MSFAINLRRLLAILFKEFVQMRRDKSTIMMLIGIPIVQLVLFGYAINLNPNYLPSVVINNDPSQFTRTLVSGLQNTKYFEFTSNKMGFNEAQEALARGKLSFIFVIPADFTQKLIRGEKPELLVINDAAEPSGGVNAILALNKLAETVFNHDLSKNGLQYLKTDDPPFKLVVHSKYNPENDTQFNIVPGLIGVILTMTMVMVTCLSIIREWESGTIETLLATPLRPLEVMLGKIIPYLFVGYVQMFIILFAAFFLFDVPMNGSLGTLLIYTLPFILANLFVGILFSTLSSSQLQALQMTMFFFLPSILLSGFMFPFYGMPRWAQILGDCLPLTHYLRIVRGIMLKGNDFVTAMPEVGALLLFTVIIGIIAMLRYKQTL